MGQKSEIAGFLHEVLHLLVELGPLIRVGDGESLDVELVVAFAAEAAMRPDGTPLYLEFKPVSG